MLSEIGAGTKKGQSSLDYDHKIMMEVVLYFKEKTQIVYHHQTDSFYFLSGFSFTHIHN